MAARLGHEVKNALNVMRGAVHNLRKPPPGAPCSTEMLTLVEEQMARLARVADHLREVTRPLELRREECDVADLLRAVIEECRCHHGRRPATHLPVLPPLRVDPVLVRRLLANALDNALRAAGPSGGVRVSARLDCHMGPDHPQIEIYEESKHGIMFAAFRERMNLGADTWVVGKDYTAAPTCATCHMSATPTLPVSHDIGQRISWTLRPVVSKRLENWEERRKRMKSVCLE